MTDLDGGVHLADVVVGKVDANGEVILNACGCGPGRGRGGKAVSEKRLSSSTCEPVLVPVEVAVHIPVRKRGAEGTVWLEKLSHDGMERGRGRGGWGRGHSSG